MYKKSVFKVGTFNYYMKHCKAKNTLYFRSGNILFAPSI